MNKFNSFMAIGFYMIFCSGILPLSAQDRMPVFVSILPQKYFVERIGGEHIEVSVMVAPGDSPATYEPRAGQMTKLAKTRLYFAIGVPFESAWLKRIAAANPEMKIIHTQEDIEKSPMGTFSLSVVDQKKAIRHRSHGDHDHGILDPHIWLAPHLVMTQARNIFSALAKQDSDHQANYLANYQKFISELADLDTHIFSQLSGLKNRYFMVFHPAWGYFARAYGLKQIPVEIEGKTPKPMLLKSLINFAGQNQIREIFVQPQFSQKSAAIIAKAIDGRVTPLDPLAENWKENILHAANVLAGALATQTDE